METNNELELINRLSRKKLTAEEVYIFPVKLCDNDLDRDNEVFSLDALKTLQTLFVGKTGISDHSMRSSDQTARIFKTWLEESPDRLTVSGEKYTALKAKAYMVRTRRNEDFIKEIDAGIKKEISISCSLRKHTCSICGKESCLHVRGKTYDGRLCYTVLSEATDAYEWSFVAVPAQREAGVTKSFKKEEKKMKDAFELIKSAFSSSEDGKTVFDYIARLEREAQDGKSYRRELSAQVKKLFALTLPEISQRTVGELCESLCTDSLKELKEGLSKNKSAVIPCAPQTAVNKTKTKLQSDNDYMI